MSTAIRALTRAKYIFSKALGALTASLNVIPERKLLFVKPEEMLDAGVFLAKGIKV